MIIGEKEQRIKIQPLSSSAKKFNIDQNKQEAGTYTIAREKTTRQARFLLPS